MRLQVWILCAMLIALFTSLQTVLADEYGPSEVTTRLLRVSDGITSGIDKANTVVTTDEERAITAPQGLKDATTNSLKWFQTKFFSAEAISKFKTKLGNFLLRIAHWTGWTAEDIAKLANSKSDPVKKAGYHALAKQLKENHPA